ncbi:MAG: RecX family transcriptional regulator [Coprobacillus sp.]|nr:RecX family transcriptional regulator [Coprobacillus sp.]
MPKEKPGKTYTISCIKVFKTCVHVSFKERDMDTMRLESETFTNHLLYSGKTLSKKELDEILHEDKLSHIYTVERNALLKKRQTEREVRDTLKEKFNNPNYKDINYIIDRLKDVKLIDDESYAIDFMELGNLHNWGENKIKEKLRERGISHEILDSLSFDLDIEVEKGRNLLPTLLSRYKKYPLNVMKGKIRNTLLYQGFSHVAVNKILDVDIKEDTEAVLSNLEKDMKRAVASRSRKKEDEREIKQKVIATLLQKGYQYNKINEVWDKLHYEND